MASRLKNRGHPFLIVGLRELGAKFCQKCPLELTLKTETAELAARRKQHDIK